MSDEAKPSYDELEVLAMLALQIAHDIGTGEFENALHGANLVQAYSYVVLRMPLGGDDGFDAWEKAIPFDERLTAALGRLAEAPERLRGHYTLVLRQAIEAYRELLAEEAKGAS